MAKNQTSENETSLNGSPKWEDKSLSSPNDEQEKRSVGKLFGIEMSAPKSMKNPIQRFTILVIANLFLLFGLGMLLK